MNNNKLHYYLPHGVQIDYPETGKHYPLVISNNTVSIRGGITLDQVYEQNLKPYLYPLSCLTQTIILNGLEKIPLVELAKIEGTYKGEESGFIIDILVWLTKDNQEVLFRYSDTYNSFFKTINGVVHHCYNQLLLFDYCYSRRINIWGIDAIDPRSVEVNPYLITSKK